MENIYEETLLDYASKVDAVMGEHGRLSKDALDIVRTMDENATKNIINIIDSGIESGKQNKEILLLLNALKDSVIRFYGYKKVLSLYEMPIYEEEEKGLSELLGDLDRLVGLKTVKEKVNDLIAYQKVQKLRKENNLYTAKGTLHLAFMGNPGTGKTTVARIVGRVYKQIGLLSKGHFVEVSRTDLIAGYQGQTALKVKKVIEKAKGGVLFIDEAYSITENDHSDSYGRECLTELTKALEDYRDDLVVIVAGYTEPMNKFFESNPGLKSRFNTFIEFEDYSVEELETILARMCVENDYMLADETKEAIKEYLSEVVSKKDNNFANGRMVRNLYDDLVMNHARRISRVESPDKEQLSLLLKEDFNCFLSL